MKLPIFTQTLLWVFFVSAEIPYVIGVFSGYYANHGPYVNSNPDIWIHSALSAAIPVVLAGLYSARRDRRSKRIRDEEVQKEKP